MERDPEQAVRDAQQDVAQGDEPSGEEREFLEAEKVDLDREDPEEWRPGSQAVKGDAT